MSSDYFYQPPISQKVYAGYDFPTQLHLWGDQSQYHGIDLYMKKDMGDDTFRLGVHYSTKLHTYSISDIHDRAFEFFRKRRQPPKQKPRIKTQSSGLCGTNGIK